MQKAHLLVLLLLVSTFSFAPSSGNVENRIMDLLENCKKILGARLSDARANVNVAATSISGKILGLPSVAVDFVNGFYNFGINYIRNALNFYVQFLLFTPAQPLEAYDLKLSEASIRNSTFNSSLDTKFLIHGYTTVLPLTSIYFEMKNIFLNQGDYNVILVNWTRHNGFPYTFASIMCAFVGFEIGKLIELLIDSANITSKSVHLIGHSIGAQTAGFAGKIVKNIGRITALDTAGPIFQYLPEFFRLFDGDADFVDAIHTNGAHTPLGGFGSIRRYGDMDFFPNGGRIQPNCSIGGSYLDIDNNFVQIKNVVEEDACHHGRAPFLFLYSIQSCEFKSVPCGSYEDFKNGKCPPDNSTVVRMGLHAKPTTAHSKFTTFYLDTTELPPFCETPS